MPPIYVAGAKMGITKRQMASGLSISLRALIAMDRPTAQDFEGAVATRAAFGSSSGRQTRFIPSSHTL